MASVSDPMTTVTYRIKRVRKECIDTFTMELAPQNGHMTGHFQPGQFNMLYVFGVGEVPISISGDPLDVRKLVHTTRAVGTVTSVMKTLKAGATIGIRGPYGTCWPVKASEGEDIVLIAGGIGLAPLRPALYEILSKRDRYGKVVLLYGARTPEDILYKTELRNLRKRFDLDIYVTVDRSTHSWMGNVGVVTKLIPKAPFDPHQVKVMICGPEVMMRYSVAVLETRGVKLDNIYVSMERNMKCGLGFCGHCQVGCYFSCKEGPVFRYDKVKDLFMVREI